jgi:hypothetical protein
MAGFATTYLVRTAASASTLGVRIQQTDATRVVQLHRIVVPYAATSFSCAFSVWKAKDLSIGSGTYATTDITWIPFDSGSPSLSSAVPVKRLLSGPVSVTGTGTVQRVSRAHLAVDATLAVQATSLSQIMASVISFNLVYEALPDAPVGLRGGQNVGLVRDDGAAINADIELLLTVPG